MRTHLNLTRSLRSLGAGLATGGLFLAANPSAFSQTLPPSPVGTWDMVVSGSQQGVAFLTFNKDFSINGFEVLTFKSSVPSTDPRNQFLGGSPGRGGILTTNTSGSTSNELFIGFGPIEGNWQFDARGRTVGFFTEGSELADLSRSPSFVAVINRTGTRMSLKAVDSPDPTLSGSQPRTCVFTGIPYTLGVTLDGPWIANGSAASTTAIQPVGRFVEFFTLTSASKLIGDPTFLENYPFFWPLTNSPAVSNSFFLTGNGPGYTNFGLALLSNQKKLGIVTENVSGSATNTDLRSEVGGFNPAKGNGSLVGIDENFTKINQKVMPVITP